METITTQRRPDGWHLIKTVNGKQVQTKCGRPSRLSALCDYLELEDEKQGERP